MSDTDSSDQAEVRKAPKRNFYKEIIANIHPQAKTVPDLYETIVKRITTTNPSHRGYFANTKLWANFKDWLDLLDVEDKDAKPDLSLFLAALAAHRTLTHKKWDRFETALFNRQLEGWAEDEMERLAREVAEADVRLSVEGGPQSDNMDEDPFFKTPSTPLIKKESIPAGSDETNISFTNTLSQKLETSQFFKHLESKAAATPSAIPPKRKLQESLYKPPTAPTPSQNKVAAKVKGEDATKDRGASKHKAKKKKIEYTTTSTQAGDADEFLKASVEERVKQQLEERVQQRLQELLEAKAKARVQIDQCCQTDPVPSTSRPGPPATPVATATWPSPAVKTEASPDHQLPANVQAGINSAVQAAISRQTETLQRSLPDAVRGVLESGMRDMMPRPDEMGVVAQYRGPVVMQPGTPMMPPPRGQYRSRPGYHGHVEGDPQWQNYC